MSTPKSILTKSQKIVTPWKDFTIGGVKYRIRAKLRYDDECGNGHNSFSITGETQAYERGCWVEDSAGCIHDKIAKRFPEYAPFIKWHLTSSDGPMHYIANTVYHASNRDHNGLLKGESRQIRNGKTGLPCWELVAVGDKPERYVDSETCPSAPEHRYVPWCRIGEGKDRDFDAARRCAVWPDATDAQLGAPESELKAALLARHPALMVEFKAAMESLGFIY